MQRKGYYVKMLHGYPHGEGSYHYGDMEFQGTWNKGLRVNEGIYITNSFSLRCKFRNGKIYKMIEFITNLNNKKSCSVILHQLNYSKEGEFYKEYLSSERCFFSIEGKKFIFDGFPVKSNNFKLRKLDEIEILGISDDQLSIRELRMGIFRYIGKLLDIVPFGPAKIIINDNCYIKGVIRGYLFTGNCKIVNNFTKMIINGEDLLKTSKIKVQLNNQYFELNVDYFESILIRSKQLSSKILNEHKITTETLVAEVLKYYINFILQVESLCKKRLSIAYSIMVNSHWLEIEKLIYRYIKEKSYILKKILDPSASVRVRDNVNYSEEIKRTEKVVFRRKYDNGSFFCGEMKDGFRHGLGSFVFACGNRYKGYFVKDRFYGVGSFETSLYRIKGIWENNRILKVISLVYF